MGAICAGRANGGLCVQGCVAVGGGGCHVLGGAATEEGMRERTGDATV